ncbi:MAG: hypothetical protein WC761_01215 [Candidatus Paceibacterota bacterium]|jgi:hypothetical protein
MKGDRIQIVSSLMFETKDEVLHVYTPVNNPDGSPQLTFEGYHVVRSVGGVKSGTTGVVTGEPIRVNRLQLHHVQNQSATVGGNDYAFMIPVFLDTYQQVGWFPTDYVRVMGGARLDPNVVNRGQ